MDTQGKQPTKGGPLVPILAVIAIVIATMAMTGWFSQKDAEGFTPSDRKIANEAIELARDGCASHNNLVFQMKLAEAKQTLRKISDAQQRSMGESMMENQLRAIGCISVLDSIN